MTPEDAEEFMAAHVQAGNAWWRMSALGLRLGVHEAVGIDRAEYARQLGGSFTLPAAERREAVVELTANGMSQRAIADVLNVDHETVRQDLRRGEKSPQDSEEQDQDDRSGETSPLPPPHVTHNSGEDEWYTPPEYLHAARFVLGDIDLDPASSAVANRVVRAEEFYTVEDDGLIQPWKGRVWMNPPYTTGVVDRFVSKLLDAHQVGDVPAAVVLTNNATDTRWWQSLARRATGVCMLAGRIRFRNATGAVAGAGLQGQTISYLGVDAERFAERFAEFGVVL